MKLKKHNIPLSGIKEVTNRMGYTWHSEDYFIGTGDVTFTNQLKEAHKINFYAVIVQLDGWIELKVDGRVIRLEKNSFFAIAPGHVCQGISRSDNSNNQTIFFTEKFLCFSFYYNYYAGLFHNFSNYFNNHIKLNATESSKVNSLFTALLEKRDQVDSEFQIEIIKNLLTAYVLEFTYIYRQNANIQQDTRYLNITKIFKKLVYDNCLQEKSIEYYANALCVSPKHLFRIIKSTTGNSPKYFIDITLVSFAKIELKNQHLTISEVASSFPFSDLQSFSKFFKKHVGISPIEYRLKVLKIGLICLILELVLDSILY
ncbi:AraC family transcriptional regulator [Elizabethkingia anophelis]|nr:AraC family transcriptional regulator [Elizabethkingia anophelis]